MPGYTEFRREAAGDGLGGVRGDLRGGPASLGAGSLLVLASPTGAAPGRLPASPTGRGWDGDGGLPHLTGGSARDYGVPAEPAGAASDMPARGAGVNRSTQISVATS